MNTARRFASPAGNTLTPETQGISAVHSSDIAIVTGTWPDPSRLEPVIGELGRYARTIEVQQGPHEGIRPVLGHNGASFDADVVLKGMHGKSQSDQISSGLALLSEHFRMSPPKVVIIGGESHLSSAAAQAASYARIPVVQVEAGLRSHDRAIPAEMNRLVTGVLADFHCAATEESRCNLIGEGIDPSSIAVTGMTVVEAVQASLAGVVRQHSAVAALEPGVEFVLAVIEHPENTESEEALNRVLFELSLIDAPVLLIATHRTRQAIARFRLDHYSRQLTMVDPASHAQILSMAHDASLVVSDSGILEEECTVLKRQLLVVRTRTERQESIDAGFARLMPPGQSISAAANSILSRKRSRLELVPSPYGDGLASRRVALVCLNIAEGMAPTTAAAWVAAAYPIQPSTLARPTLEAVASRDVWEWM